VLKETTKSKPHTETAHQLAIKVDHRLKGFNKNLTQRMTNRIEDTAECNSTLAIGGIWFLSWLRRDLAESCMLRKKFSCKNSCLRIAKSVNL
jgi:hypothetical protein